MNVLQKYLMAKFGTIDHAKKLKDVKPSDLDKSYRGGIREFFHNRTIGMINKKLQKE